MRAIGTLALVGALIGSPAYAAGERARAPAREPAVAAGLAVAAPVGLFLLSRTSSEALVHLSLPMLGLGAGHYYAGDPVRGGLVTVGSAAAGLGAFNVFLARGTANGAAYATGFLALALAMGLAAQDAYFTAERLNRVELEQAFAP